MADNKAPTHTAFVLKREGRKHGRWLEIGNGRADNDGTFHAFIDRMPVGGFNGYVHFAPTGKEPPQPEPERPAQHGSGDEEG